MEIPGLTRVHPGSPGLSPSEQSASMVVNNEPKRDIKVPNIRPDLEAKIAAMRAQIRQKETQIAPTLQVHPDSEKESKAVTEDPINFGVLDQALMTHGFEPMSDSDQDMDMDMDLDIDIEQKGIETDSDTSTFVSSSDSDSDDESSSAMSPITAEERERMLIAADNEGTVSDDVPKTKNETAIDEEPVQVPDFEISATDEIEPLGVISNIVGSSCVVTGEPSSDTRVLDCGSLLVFEDRKNLGFIADTFGPVVCPMFCVRFRTSKDLEDAGVSPGRSVFLVQKHAKYVFGDTLLVKGTDASNIHDEEQSETEFSDDEKEALYKSQKKQQRRAEKVDNGRSSRPLNDLQSIAMAQGMIYDPSMNRLQQEPKHAESLVEGNQALRDSQPRRARGLGKRASRGRPEVNNYGRGPLAPSNSAPARPPVAENRAAGESPQVYRRSFYQPNPSQNDVKPEQPNVPTTSMNPVGPTLYQPLKRPT